MKYDIDYRIETRGDGFFAEAIDTNVSAYGKTVNEALEALFTSLAKENAQSA